MSKRTVRPEPGRKYFNHLAEHTRGEWHRHRLLSTGRYVKTSERRSGSQGGARLSEVSWMTTDDLSLFTCHCGRIACRHHEET